MFSAEDDTSGGRRPAKDRLVQVRHVPGLVREVFPTDRRPHARWTLRSHVPGLRQPAHIQA